jgi:hypothetical protein
MATLLKHGKRDDLAFIESGTIWLGRTLGLSFTLR